MVSLLKLSEVTEEGVVFQSPHDGSNMLLTPEKSIEIQNSIGDFYDLNLCWHWSSGGLMTLPSIVELWMKKE